MMRKNHPSFLTLNVGNPYETTIKNIAERVKKTLEYDGEIVWSQKVGDGVDSKRSDSRLFQEMFGFEYTSFSKALRETCKWFLQKYPCVKGVKEFIF